MTEGEILKGELLKFYKNITKASKALNISRTSLYEYFEMEKVPTDFLEKFKENSGVDIRKGPIGHADRQKSDYEVKLEQKIARLENEVSELDRKFNSDISELKSYVLKILNK